ncbi:MAG: ABC transporter permease [Pseudomonadota bacterium]
MMTLRDFRSGWRLLLKQPGNSAIMIGGLAIGFAVFFLTLAFARYEYGFDTHVPKVEEVVVLKARPNWGYPFWSENVPLSMKDSLEKSGAPLATSAVLPYTASMRVGQTTHKVELTLVDPVFPLVLGIRALEGDLTAALSRPDAIALTPDTARVLFGDAHALGKQVQIMGHSYLVAAIVAQQPQTSSVRFDALASLASSAWPDQQRVQAHQYWSYYGDGEDFVNCKVYARLPRGVDRAALLRTIEADVERSALRGHLTNKNTVELGKRGLIDVAMTPLADSYLDFDARTNSGAKGDRASTYAIVGVAFLILLLTAGNYVNLATIRTIARQREMAIRKVLGIGAWRLLAQMMAESIVVSMFAALCGALLAWLLLPAWSDFTEHNMLVILTTRDWIAFGAIVVAMGAAVGACAAVYPAWTALKMRSTDALGERANGASATGLWLRRTLTVMQFAIAMFVTAVAVAIASQIDHLRHIDYGYQLDTLLTVRPPPELGPLAAREFRDALARLPQIEGVTASSPWPDTREYKTSASELVSLQTLRVGPEYFATIGLKAIAGRTFDPAIDGRDNAGVIVVSAAAARKLGYADPAAAVGQLVGIGDVPMRVVGVSGDAARGFMQGPIKPRVYAIGDAPELTINGGHDLAGAQAAIEASWRAHFPNHYVAVHNLRAELELNAGGPTEILRTCILVVAIILPLAVFSIYILSAYAVQRRAREIVMRKLYGARPLDIARLLAREFAVLLGVAALLALPGAYLAGRMFIEQFADQAQIGLWGLAGTLAGALAVTVLATLRHTRAAARMSPAQVLRLA